MKKLLTITLLLLINNAYAHTCIRTSAPSSQKDYSQFCKNLSAKGAPLTFTSQDNSISVTVLYNDGDHTIHGDITYVQDGKQYKNGTHGNCTYGNILLQWSSLPAPLHQGVLTADIQGPPNVIQSVCFGHRKGPDLINNKS